MPVWASAAGLKGMKPKQKITLSLSSLDRKPLQQQESWYSHLTINALYLSRHPKLFVNRGLPKNEVSGFGATFIT